MKRIGIGVSDFKKIIEEEFYYFDKTKFIEEIIQDGAEVKLFTRPRRFGKTLNMSMLKYFFDRKDAEENRKIFKGLYIEKKESFKEQGQYPVIFLSLKDLKLNDRLYKCCNCGLEIDRDYNASINLEKAKIYKVIA